MHTNATRIPLVVLLAVLVATPVLAHVPTFPADNTSPERAVAVPDAAKSWSFYDRLASGQTRYYRLSLAAGDRLRVGTFTPSAGSLTPSVVLLSDSFEGREGVPPQVTVPDGMGAVVIEGARPARASYEPFAPSATYRTTSVDRTVPAGGTYLVAVYEPRNRAGAVGVALGYEESFTPTEYLTVPFDLVQVRRWAGQHPLVVFGPGVAVLVAGAAALRRRREAVTRSAARVALVVAGLLVLGSAASTLVQMGLALTATGPSAGALVTAAFVVVPAVCGAWMLRVATRAAGSLGRGTRATLGVAGVAALATWAGFLVGPALAVAVAVAPTGRGDDADPPRTP